MTAKVSSRFSARVSSGKWWMDVVPNCWVLRHHTATGRLWISFKDGEMSPAETGSMASFINLCTSASAGHTPAISRSQLRL